MSAFNQSHCIASRATHVGIGVGSRLENFRIQDSGFTRVACKAALETKADFSPAVSDSRFADCATWVAGRDRRLADCATWFAGRDRRSADCATWLAGRDRRSADCATWLAGRDSRFADCATWPVERDRRSADCATWLAEREGARVSYSPDFPALHALAARGEWSSTHTRSGSAPHSTLN